MAEAKERKLPAPAVSQETQAYWDAAAKGKLLVRKCTSCGELHHYPRTICPFLSRVSCCAFTTSSFQRMPSLGGGTLKRLNRSLL